jgi:hypothetical protein
MSNRLFDIYDELKDSLSVLVKIDHVQVHKVIIRDLINKRKSCLERKDLKGVEHFDYVLIYYLGEDDYKKYIIDGAVVVP